MTVDLEEQLRQAYDGLPTDETGSGQLAQHAQRFGTRRKHLRAAGGVGAGLVAAAAVTAIALGSGTLGAGAATTNRRQPAGQAIGLQLAQPTGTRSQPTSPPPGYQGYWTPPTLSSDASQHMNKKVDGLAGYLLPHGSQLPGGLSYPGNRSASNVNGFALPAGVNPALVGYRISIGFGKTIDNPKAPIAFVHDCALNFRADGSVAGDENPDLRSLATGINEYRSTAQARAVVPAVHASPQGGSWVDQSGVVRVPWAGIAGADGPSYLYRVPPMSIPGRTDLKFPLNYVAVQIDGKYLIWATGDSQQDVSTAIGSTISNLKAANLL